MLKRNRDQRSQHGDVYVLCRDDIAATRSGVEAFMGLEASVAASAVGGPDIGRSSQSGSDMGPSSQSGCDMGPSSQSGSDRGRGSVRGNIQEQFSINPDVLSEQVASKLIKRVRHQQQHQQQQQQPQDQQYVQESSSRSV